MLNSFARWIVSRTKREAYKAAHGLAKDAVMLGNDAYGWKNTNFYSPLSYLGESSFFDLIAFLDMFHEPY